jgi:aldehyde:ferredoxin oxidoreductase
VLQDEFAVTRLMSIELKARLVCEQRFQKRFALDELKPRDVPAVDMQEIKGLIHELHSALAVGGSLGMGKARQSSLIDATEFAIEISGLDVQVHKRCDGAWVFVGPVSPVRVSSCARPLSMRAAMRKPSSFISCSH